MFKEQPLVYPKSGSVWYEQLDIALVGLLSSIKVENEHGKLEPTRVLIKNTNTELRHFPCISISHYDERYSAKRSGRENFVIDTDEERGVVVLEQPAQAYDLYFQIELWAEYNTDINTMSMQFLSLIGEHHSLKVIDTMGNPRVCVMDRVDYKPLDYVDAELQKNILRRAYSYKIQVELDERPQIEKQFASQVEVNR